MQIKIDVAKLVREAVGATPEITPCEDGGAILTFTLSDGDAATKAGKAVARKLAAIGVTDGYTGGKEGGVLTIRLGLDGATPPATWLPKSAKSTEERDETLSRVLDTLKGAKLKVGYFNSGKVTQSRGIAVHDETVQCGLQFQLDPEDGALVAKVQKGNSWSVAAIEEDQVLAIVRNCQRLFAI
jgi:hypothetical protein